MKAPQASRLLQRLKPSARKAALETLLRIDEGFPVQQALSEVLDRAGLDERGRMNTPGTVGLNWKWCLKPDYLLELEPAEIKAMCRKYGRC